MSQEKNDEITRVGTNGNAAIYFVDRHRSGDISAKPAFIEGEENGRTLTYGELAAQSDRLASLYQRHGLRREDRAAVLLFDTIEFPVIFWGSLKAGVVPILLNTLLSADVYETILTDSRARALFVSGELFHVVEPVLANNPFLEAVFVVGGNGAAGGLSFADELAASTQRDPVEVAPDDCAFWLYSSGSTGAPKGVRHVHASLKATADTYGKQVLGIEPDGVG